MSHVSLKLPKDLIRSIVFRFNGKSCQTLEATAHPALICRNWIIPRVNHCFTILSSALWDAMQLILPEPSPSETIIRSLCLFGFVIVTHYILAIYSSKNMSSSQWTTLYLINPNRFFCVNTHPLNALSQLLGQPSIAGPVPAGTRLSDPGKLQANLWSVRILQRPPNEFLHPYLHYASVCTVG